MIDILIFGQAPNSLRIARALNSPIADVRATFIQPARYLPLLAMTPRSERAVIVRVGYRVGATTAKGRLFDAYWSMLRRRHPNAVACHYWLGTDVLDTINEAGAATIRWAALSAARDDLHLTTAPWLTSELESVGLHAITAPLPAQQRIPPVAPPMPLDFSVLTYLPMARFNFYGGPVILDAARRMPTVRFDVVGGPADPARSATANVHWHGWVRDMAERYAQTTVVVRIPQHDGFGNTVIEGLLNARHVIYTQEVPFVRRVWPATAEALVAALKEFQDAHAGRRLVPNLAGRAYAIVEFDEERLVHNLLALVRARLSAERS